MVEYLELFVVEFLIGITCGGIFTSAIVGSIRDRIFINVRIRNIAIKPSFKIYIYIHTHTHTLI
jgi:hypothetical protein